MFCFAVSFLPPCNSIIKTSLWLVNFWINNFEDKSIVLGIDRIIFVLVSYMICDGDASSSMFFYVQSSLFRRHGRELYHFSSMLKGLGTVVDLKSALVQPLARSSL